MARNSFNPVSIPPFTGATRNLLLWNVIAFFLLNVLHWVAPALSAWMMLHLALVPAMAAHGFVWQLVTYSFVSGGFISTVFALMSLWYAGNLLESQFNSTWLYELYFSSVIGGALLASAISFTHIFGLSEVSLGVAQWSGIFGIMVGVGYYFAETEFNVMFVLRMKAKVMVTLYIVLLSAELLTSGDRFGALLQLCGGLAGYGYCRFAPRRGLGFSAGFSLSERFYSMRNAYYRNKRRQAAKKFEVYMRKQNRDVHFDSNGRYVDPEERTPGRDPNDKRWMN